MVEQIQQQALSENKPNLLYDAYIGTAEETYNKSPLVPDTYKDPYNPDDLWQKTGDYSIYEDMMNDDQVSVCMKLKKDLILGSGFHFIKENEGEDEIEEFLESTFNNDQDFPFVESLEEILSAYEFGFSLTEKVFKIRDDNFLTLKFIKTRHPNSWLIHNDDKGNILKYVQRTNHGDLEIQKESLIHFITNKQFQNPYGKSDLRTCYNAWFAKRQVIRYLAIFLEKAAGPIPVASYDKNISKQAIADIHNSIKKFQTKTALTIPKEIEIQFLESKNTGEAYSKAMNIFNMFIGRSLFIPDLLGMSGSETGGGSYSLGKEQINLFFLHINRRRKTIEDLINKHIIWPIILYNYGQIKDYPKFKFKPIDDDKAVELGKLWLEAVKGNVYQANEDEINHFRKLVKFPEGEVVMKQPQLQVNPMDQQIQKQQSPIEDPIEEKKTFANQYDQVPGSYYKKVNFKQLKTKLDDYDQSIVNETKLIVKKIYQDLYEQLDKKNIINSHAVDRIDSIKLKYLKELKQSLKSSFMSLYKDAQTQAQLELNKSNFKQPTTSQEFLDLLESENYNYIGDWQYNILKKARIEIIAAIKDGRPLSTVIDILDSDGIKLSEVSLERYARTKHTEVMNRGRLKAFEDSGVVAGYQYSAIMDDRTSEICSGLHGKFFKAGDEPVPPMHFNCRSMLIPITKYEEFTPTEKVRSQPIDEFINDNLGEGFSIK